ncbi:Glyoxalase/bleomycin resistance protein/dioxygenase [Mesorhizobium sp. ORS 3359]|nr:Glyoxalase/bleomycin resistance protein/dioxygenase [Mesorhizobium sp. ORS 3359]
MANFQLPARNTRSTFADMRGHHVALRVSDFAKAKSWYTEKLDFRVVHEWPYADEELAYLAPPNDDNFMIELLAGGDPLPIAAPSYTDLGDSLRYAGYHHFCINVADMDKTVAELKARGVTIVTEPFKLDAISRKLAFFADPFGNLIELAEIVD